MEADGRLTAFIRLALNRRRPDRTKIVQAPVLRMVHVTNTGGGREERPMIEAAIRLGPVEKRIRLTITRRDALRFPMILGREALASDFIVDAARTYLLRRD